MIKHLLALTSLLFITITAKAQKNIYESNKFDEISAEHHTLAILPFLTRLDLKDDLTVEELRELEKKEGLAVQNALETYFSKRKEKKKFTVNFQNTRNTNAILAQNNITYDNIDVHTITELSEILGVDGIISGTLDLNILLSKGVPTDFSIIDYFLGQANYGRIGIKISDGKLGKLLWKYEKEITKKTGKNTNDFIDKMMKMAAKKFPYDRPNRKERKEMRNSN